MTLKENKCVSANHVTTARRQTNRYKTSDVQADLVPESLKQEIIDHCQSILQVNSLSYDDNFITLVRIH